jgi:hypothetical protein
MTAVSREVLVSIHQPHFLPWLGYFNKVMYSDVFVSLHNVQFRKNYFQNRTLIRDSIGKPLWLTLPVSATLSTRIDEVPIVDPRWRERIVKTIEQSYRKAPYFASEWPRILAAIKESTDLLEDVNARLFEVLLGALGSTVSYKAAREFDVHAEEPNRRLLELCQAVAGTTYIAGKGGRNYLDVGLFESSGIRVVWQEYDPATVVYPQGGGEFVPGLSIIDCLFNVGPVECRHLVMRAWCPPTL